MILFLSKFQKPASLVLLTALTMGILPLDVMAGRTDFRLLGETEKPSKSYMIDWRSIGKTLKSPDQEPVKEQSLLQERDKEIVYNSNLSLEEEDDTGGPSQPEMATFKSIGTDNMVDLFTGNFSYNIPLLDVGGYPVNIFYNGDIGMDQDASWVGLGWNINPGTITRNMRGVPDDFDGSEEQEQVQKIRPNITWGVTLGVGGELVGLKGLASNASLGMSFNNKLGPALETMLSGGVSVKIAEVMMDKSSNNSFSARFGINGALNLSSRDGLSFSPSVSLGASISSSEKNTSFGISSSVSTSINSRIGTKGLQISEQLSFSKGESVLNNGKISPAGSWGMRSSSTISFVKPSYLPVVNNPITHSNFVAQMQVGAGYAGVEGTSDIQIFKQKSEIKDADSKITKPMVGALYSQVVKDDMKYIMDYTRMNDKEILKETPVISVPQYTYDVFSISGEGTSGSIRLYRSDIGFMREALSESKSSSTSVGLEVSPPGQYGGNFSNTQSPSRVGGWTEGNLLKRSLPFSENTGIIERAYFRNPGENTVLLDNEYAGIADDNLVRYKLTGNGFNPVLQPRLEKFNESGVKTGELNIGVNNTRRKRTQVVSFFTAAEADNIGLEQKINSYRLNEGYSGTGNLLIKEEISRFGNDYRKRNHISQVNVLEANGSTYVYGLPVYNISQEEILFSTIENDENKPENLIPVIGSELDPATNSNLSSDAPRDGYYQKTKTPGYAHAFLLTGLLSSDYVDVKNDGITDDDLGNAVKFNYGRMKKADNSWDDYVWRSPSLNDKANFLTGKHSDKKDDKGSIVFGTRESWYLQSIESKSMIAIFRVSDREDMNGFTLSNAVAGLNSNDKSVQKLDRIDLYNKSDLVKNGLQKARPVKSVHFEYTYDLCPSFSTNSKASVPGNTKQGKLTLKRLYFTYNGINKTSVIATQKVRQEQYLFDYGNINNTDDNPHYKLNVSDRWGTYKGNNYKNLKHSLYPYTIQGEGNKETADKRAGAWSLKKILLPSGGQLEVDYESDDYGYVQDRVAMQMMDIYAFGTGPNVYGLSGNDSYLYERKGSSSDQFDYVFVKLPKPVTTKEAFINYYLKGVTQLSVKMAVYIQEGIKEYIPTYAEIFMNNGVPECGIKSGTDNIGWIRVKRVNNYSPFTISALEFLRLQLPGLAYPGYDASEGSSINQIVTMFTGLLGSLDMGFGSPIEWFIERNKCRRVDVSESFVRLNNPERMKFGGGSRVKEVRIKDNWNNIATGQFTSVYGQKYTYTTKETINGEELDISSGVANYEPMIGNEENPFLHVLTVKDDMPLGPTTYGAIEFPVVDAFFPSPVVGYSKVTVESIGKHPDPDADIKSKVGKQVTEFNTAKEYPYYSKHTKLDYISDMSASSSPTFNFFVRNTLERRTISQGFIVRINDMHGKIKSQKSYSSSDLNTAINETNYLYKNTGQNGMNDKVDFIYASEGGQIRQGNIGVDIELMTDTREYSVNVKGRDIEGQLMAYTFFFLPAVYWINSKSVNRYNEVTCTKTVNYRSILDKVVERSYGSIITTENLLYDSETGSVVVSKINNEYNQPIYNVNYPAYWGYYDIGGAYKNIGATYQGVNFVNGKIDNATALKDIVHTGDELYIVNPGSAGNDCIGSSSGEVKKIWAISNENLTFTNSSLAAPFIFVDEKGLLYNRSNVSVKIVRSGYRNLLAENLATVQLLENPVRTVGSIKKLSIDFNSKVFNAGAVEYKHKWQVDNDVVKKLRLETVGCVESEVLDCENGYLEKTINPYLKGLIGNYRAHKKYVYYSDRNNETVTDRRTAGLFSFFKLKWDFNTSTNKLEKDNDNARWVWQSEATKFNKRGFEIENVNAFGIYSSAQYGYNKILPVATANNTRHHELWYDGFEDYGFKSAVNVAGNEVCDDRPLKLNLANQTNASIVTNTAHTGKSALKLNAKSVLSNGIAIRSGNSSGIFSLVSNKKDLTRLNNPGSNALPHTISPATYLGVPQTSFIRSPYKSNLSAIYTACLDANQSPLVYTCGINSSYSYFVQIDKCDNYNMYVNLLHTFLDNPLVNPGASIGAYMELTITNAITNEVVHELDCGTLLGGTLTAEQMNNHLSFLLDKGTYKFLITFQFSLYDDPYARECFQGGYTVTTDFDDKVFKTLDNSIACSSLEPISSTSSMLNGGLEIIKGKQMVISGWVKQDAASTLPCNKNTFCDGYLSLNIPNGTFKASGPIIEGWQRIEGVFTVPENATSLNLTLHNESNANVYFDDLRIHPYNANIKSYVYDPVNLRLVAELDANNFSWFYEYDAEGTLIRTKVETIQGIKTTNETRSSKQKTIDAIQ